MSVDDGWLDFVCVAWNQEMTETGLKTNRTTHYQLNSQMQMVTGVCLSYQRQHMKDHDLQPFVYSQSFLYYYEDTPTVVFFKQDSTDEDD